jgi:hypothetical protein
VLINELDMAGAIIIDIFESKPVALPKKQEIKPVETVHNFFSEKAFVQQIKTKKTDSEKQDNESDGSQAIPSSEYIDSKTGHIYVQGDTREPLSLILEHGQLFLKT